MFCSKCGAEMGAMAQVCAKCGQPMAAIQSGGVAAAPALVAPSNSGKAIASLVLGILWLGGLGSILAVVFGVIARKEIKASGGALKGDGMALAGLILGIIGIAGAVAYWVGIAIFIRHHIPMGPGTPA